MTNPIETALAEVNAQIERQSVEIAEAREYIRGMQDVRDRIAAALMAQADPAPKPRADVQALVLTYITDHPMNDLSPEAIAKALGRKKSQIDGALSALMRKGGIVRAGSTYAVAAETREAAE